ncbi:MAG: ABC-F family ATP-binding cassette domain-containing protein [Candidatus Cryptobacteroides sp.]|nr:ABC-F family ATP-binding cassette domain-containing protein [Candidatus Cryptobacteroides sp.]
MISLDDITVAYGSYVLLDKINFHISETDKIGLVGKNGAGKSTILKLICGIQSPTSGHIDKPNEISIGYLPQIMEHHRGKTVLEEALTAFEHTSSIEKEIESVTLELSERTDYESESYASLIERLAYLNDRLAVSHSEPPEVQARKTLRGLGFKDEELGRLTETFSQGWNMRIELAKILLSDPQVLLLDEPTNHLDIESIEWLENYLKSKRVSILLVSHDRKFLDTVTNRTIEVMLGRIHDYKVPYSKYLDLRKERLAQQTAAYENQQRMIQKTEEFINAFRYKPTKSNQVQSRIKALEKLERVEIDETDNVTLSVKFPPAPRSGDVVFKAVELSAGYPGKLVFSGADIEVKRGEKVALVGRNGEGKTTLMRVIMGELQPLAGSAVTGHNVDIGYFAQNQEDILDKNETVFSTLDRIAVGDIRSKLRDILAQFLFRGDDIDKRVGVLSGGERARLGMAKLMLQSHNLLALDEPTNHMDIKSKDILKQALKSYDGTLIVVSHDRDFLDGLVDKLYEFKDGRVREFLGSVSDYLESRRLETLHELERVRVPAAAAADNAAVQAPKEQEKSSQAEIIARNKEKNRIDRKKKNRISYLECEIAKVEKKMAAIEAVLSNPGEGDDIMELTRSYLECKRDHDAWTEEWCELSE